VAQRLAVGAAYLVLMTAWVYGIANRTGDDSHDWLVWVLLVAQPVMGLLVGRWWAVVLPVVVVAISVPAGYPPITPENAEPFPIWFALGWGALFAIPVIVAGVVARKVYERRQAATVIT
jgi:hypothetical protein